MLRFAEIAMFLAPFAAFALWRFTAARGGPSTLVLAFTGLALVVLIVALVGFSRQNALTGPERYVPARIENGSIVPGHGAGRP